MISEDEEGGIARRNVLAAAAGMTALAGAGLAAPASGAPAPVPPAPGETPREDRITTKDGVSLYFKDWGPASGPVVTLSHGWPLSSDSWENQSFWPTRAFASSLMIGAVTGAPASPGPATTWTTTPTIWRP